LIEICTRKNWKKFKNMLQ